jgi:hypothetical protein
MLPALLSRTQSAGAPGAALLSCLRQLSTGSLKDVLAAKIPVQQASAALPNAQSCMSTDRITETHALV